MPIDHDQVHIVAAMLTDDPDVLVENDMAMLGPIGAPDLAGPDSDEPDIWNQIDEITTKPWKTWAKLVDGGTADVSKDRWDDPGDYPSGAGQYALPSYDYIDSVDMTLVFEIVPELAMLFEKGDMDGGTLPYNEIFEGNLLDVANEAMASELPGAHATWNVTRKGNHIIYSASDVDTTDVDMSPPEREWDDY